MPSHANHLTRYSSCWFPDDIMANPVDDLDCDEPNKGELQSKFLTYEFEHVAKIDRMYVIMIAFCQQGFLDQRCSETPQFVTIMMVIRGLHSAEGHCNLQYSELYSASCELTG
jgi:hypothetical protein